MNNNPQNPIGYPAQAYPAAACPAAAMPAPAGGHPAPTPAWTPAVAVAESADPVQAQERPAADFVFMLLLVQASLWILAALADVVFGIALVSVGNLFSAIVTLGVATFAIVLAGCIVCSRGWARRAAIILEALFLSGWLLGVLINLALIRVPPSLLFSDGPVTLLTDVGIPLTVMVLLLRKPPRALRRAAG